MRIKNIFTIACLLLMLHSGAQAQSGSWETLSSIGFTPRHGISASVVDGKIYVIGGAFLNTLEVYDPSTDSWSTPQTQGNFDPHFSHTASVVNGKIYVIGGVKNNIEFNDSVSVFNPQTNIWSTVPITSESGTFTSRFALTSSVIGDDIYAIGGELGVYWLTTAVEVFNVKSQTWTTPEVTKDSLRSVFSPISFVIGGKIYVVGHPVDSTCHCNVQVYDPQNNKWSVPQQGKMNVDHYFFGAGVINEKIYVTGGGDWYHGNFPTGVTEFFDPATGIWDTVATTGTFTKRDYFGSCAIGNKIYAMGGGDGTSNKNEVLTINENAVNSSGKIYYSSRIYPNPATTTLNLVSVETPTKYKIIDVLGREMMTGMTLDHATLTLDISSLLRGIYFVFVERSDVKGVFVSVGKLCAVGSVH